MTFDNDAELHKIKKTFPDARLVLRILPPNNQAAVCNFGSKFGAYLGDCAPLLRLARELGLVVVGVRSRSRPPQAWPSRLTARPPP